jgi:hypothetical protein
LALDFTTASLDARVAVTRALNTATAVNSSGFVAAVNADLPRFDYDPVTKVCKGLLIEETRINYMTYSQDFAGANWTFDLGTATGSSGTSPDGTNNAFNLVPNTTVGNHRLRQLVASAPASGGVTSYFVKANGYNWAKIRLGGLWANINLATGAAGFSNVTPSIDNYGDGWWRISIYNSAAINSVFSYIYPLEINENSTDPTNWAGDGVKGILAWGSQLEVGAFPTSYIPNLTTGTTTRNADAVSMTGTNFSDWYNESEGAFKVCAGLLSDITSSTILAVKNAAVTNTIGFDLDASNGLRWRITDAGANQAFCYLASPATANTRYTLCGRYKVNSFAASANGGAPVTDSAGTVPATNTYLAIGSNSALGATPINGYIECVYYWPQALINAEIQAFSK